MKAVVVLLFLVASFSASVRAETSVTETEAVAQTEAVAEQQAESTLAVAADSETEAESEAQAASEIVAESEAAAEGESESEAEAETEAATESQTELDAAHENTVQTLEEYTEKAHALRDEIVSSEHSLMEAMAQIDSCPPGELSALMARAKKQISHLFQIKALYLAIKQQETQLRALVDAGTGSRVPNLAPKRPAPQAPRARTQPSAAAPKTTDYAGLSSMNAKLHNALARLEAVTKRLAVVEHRQAKSKTATLVIAGQMETDEKRLNKHSRVLRRVRDSVKAIKAQIARLEKSVKRSGAAEQRLTPKAGKKAGKKYGPKKSKKQLKTRALHLVKCLQKCRSSHPKGHKAGAKKCALKCFRAHSHSAQPHKIVPYTPKRAAKRAAKRKAARRTAKARAARRAAKGKGKGKGKGKAVKRAAPKGESKAAKAKRVAAYRKCVKACPIARAKTARTRMLVRSNAARAKCRKACAARYAAPKAAAAKKPTNQALKTCFKSCRKGKRWDQKCLKSCRARFAPKKQWSAKKLNACFVTCRGRSRVVMKGKRRVTVRGKYNKKCVAACRKRFGRPPKAVARKPNVLLKRCYNTCKKVSGKGRARRTRWDMKCVKRCRTRYTHRTRAPHTAAYKACLKRCRPGKAFARCKKACAKHNRASPMKVVSPSAKAVAAAIKGLHKKPVAKPSRPETWEDVVRDSRRLLKKSVRLRDLVHKQVAHHFDTKDVEGRKYNGWWSIWDVLKGVKPGAHYTGRAKAIAADVKQIMAPALARAADGPYGEVVSVLKGADDAFSSKYTKELGSPALDLTVDPKFDGYVEQPLPGAHIKHVPYNPKKPYEPSQYAWKKSPPLSRLPELKDEYSDNLSPVYVKDFKAVPRKAPEPTQPFALATKNYDYPQIPYSFPVTMVQHDPTTKNPHVRAPTPGFHPDWPEFRFQQTEAAAPAAPTAVAAAAPQNAELAQAQPMTEGTNDA